MLRKILDLGSGTGLTGIALCCLCNPCEYHFTDYHSEVLKGLKVNIELNLSLSKCKSFVINVLQCHVVVAGRDQIKAAIHQLDWLSDDCLSRLGDHYDIIIATGISFVLVLSLPCCCLLMTQVNSPYLHMTQCH